MNTEKPLDPTRRFQSLAISIVSVSSACMAAVAMTALICATILGSRKEKKTSWRMDSLD